MNLQLLKSLVEFLLIQLSVAPRKSSTSCGYIAKLSINLVQMLGRRIIAIQKKSMRSLVGKRMHQVSAAGQSIAPCAANLLVIAFERGG